MGPDTAAAANTSTGKPAWLAPVVVVAIVVALVVGGKQKREIVENPLVDFMILTVGVFAFAAGFRWAAVQMGSTGLATFFGGSTK
jgi:hypothetical protein